MITFDNGYPPQVRLAPKVLGRYGWPGVLFEITEEHLTPPYILPIIAKGWEVDSHSATHPDLTQLSGAELAYEVAGSRRFLQRTYGVPSDNFCYPSSLYDSSTIAAVKAAGYVGAVTEEPGYASRDRPYELNRYEIEGGAGRGSAGRRSPGIAVSHRGAQPWAQDIKRTSLTLMLGCSRPRSSGDSVPRPSARTLVALTPLAALLAVLLAGCGSAGPSSAGASGKLNVVAAEDFWGSIAQQLGGNRVEVTSIITNPAADPHDYEPSAEDARTMAGAQLAIVNGIGYDQWATNLLDANPSSDRTVLTVGDLLGLKDGDNPHQWYSPTSVQKVIEEITADYKRADPGHAAYFDAQRRRFESAGLASYHRLISQIRSRYAGTPVGASESIFEPLALALGLKLITPRGFMDGIAEGTEPTSADKAAADRQIADGQIELWVYNSQNATPDVRRLNDAARAAGVPIATVTETMTPEGTSFEAWQSRELEGLAAALAKVGGGE